MKLTSYTEVMEERRYPIESDLARALDVVGGRWTLLVVQVLLGGARRFTEVAAELSGISSNLLAERLRQLEDFGIVERVLLDEPRAAVAYRLTARGSELRSTVRVLAAWGSGLSQS